MLGHVFKDLVLVTNASTLIASAGQKSPKVIVRGVAGSEKVC
jgi:hypothetical protein